MALPQAILFDLDDTLVAFDCVSVPVWKDVCARHWAEHKLVRPEALLGAIRDVSKWYWGDPDRHRTGRNNLARARREIVRTAFVKLHLAASEEADLIANEYSRKRLEAMYVLPGAREALATLKSLGVKMALVTNGEAEMQRDKVRRFDLERYFDAILIEGELGFGKPEMRIYETALRALDAQPSSSWIVGDNLEWEIMVPSKLGLYTVWHDWRGQGLPAGSPAKPDRIITSPSDLIPGAE